MSESINDRVNEALRLWAKIAGIPDAKADGPGGEIRDYEIANHANELNESRRLDPTGVTTFMMLAGLLDEHLKRAKFTYEAVLLRPAEVEAALGPARVLREVLADPEVRAVVDEFKRTMEDAVAFYDAQGDKRKAALELIESPYGMAFLRRDALASFDRLDAHQFSFGEPSGKPFKYNRQVYEFWNINSLVLAMRDSALPHVSLVLIRDPEVELASYFVLAIANGESLTVLTDREEGPHPAYNRMSRRPDRNLERRAQKNWFPYRLLDLARPRHVDEVGQVVEGRLHAKVRKQLVPISTEGVPLQKVADLEAEELLWLAMVFEKIRVTYGRENRRLPELSYTGEMVVTPHALVGSASALVRSGRYQPLELPDISKETLANVHADPQWEKAPVRHNQWMVERYGHLVPDAVLSLVGRSESLMLPADVGESLMPTEDPPRDLLASSFDLQALSPVNFGPAKKIADDRLWAARVNQMRAIQTFADREFEAERENVERWYRDAVAGRREFILDAVAWMTLPLPRASWRRDSESFFKMPKEGSARVENVESMRVGFGPRVGKTEPEVHCMAWSVLLGDVRTTRYECAVEPGAPAVVFAAISPQSSEGLAVLLGVEVADLPWPLQHWMLSEPYTGNHILTRLDPVDWALRNPWSDHHESRRFEGVVLVCLSKGAFNDRRRALGLPAVPISAKAPARSWADAYEGKRVRLRYDMETRAGDKFKKGEVMVVTSTRRRKLNLKSLDGKKLIRAVEPFDVRVVQEETSS